MANDLIEDILHTTQIIEKADNIRRPILYRLLDVLYVDLTLRVIAAENTNAKNLANLTALANHDGTKQ